MSSRLSEVITGMEEQAPFRGLNDSEFENKLGDSRSECYAVLKGYDDAMIKGWKGEIESLLFFVSHLVLFHRTRFI